MPTAAKVTHVSYASDPLPPIQSDVTVETAATFTSLGALPGFGALL